MNRKAFKGFLKEITFSRDENYRLDVHLVLAEYFSNIFNTKKKTERKTPGLKFYGISLLISLGNIEVSRILFLLSSFISSLSSPIPRPPCGGKPYL